ncbi:pyridoxal-phosphate dependent enzyme [Microtetraspora sp. AC03309]|uniref:PLP-dependent cysteine synthase family protein n=1 Tax=Microtetraspora sp. AC03309 TaxID=2779376 RepID=UPI001E296B79|nr:pyridoxal-phosphate dependent enzyme [Microtetraspora sp. AC03309]MCC5575745.1 pyridoxal-phosphate dependent enzyme [Microtetraspora sp. AC03309]
MISTWATQAIGRLDQEQEWAGTTPLREFPLPAGWGVRLLLKDESAQPTGGLKHRLARALFRDAIVTGRISEGTTVVEATGGAMATAQAYFARLLGLPYIAVMPKKSSGVDVERLGGTCRYVDPPLAVYGEAGHLADRLGGHYLDHYTAAATVDWHGGSLAEELFRQVDECPRWIVVGAGTGATSAAVGRHLRGHGLPGRLAVVDPENSAYFPGWTYGAADYATGMPSRIEGIGRPRMEPGFATDVVDLVVPVPDAASVAAARRVREATGLAVGAATGANLWGALELIDRMRAEGVCGDVVTVIGDAGTRHLRTCHDDAWAESKGLDWRPHAARLTRLLDHEGPWTPARE